MPIYTYKCENCKHEQDELIFGNSLEKDDKNLIQCEECGSYELKRILSGTSFRLIYDNKIDTCDWNGNSSQYHRKDIDHSKGPAYLPGR